MTARRSRADESRPAAAAGGEPSSPGSFDAHLHAPPGPDVDMGGAQGAQEAPLRATAASPSAPPGAAAPGGPMAGLGGSGAAGGTIKAVGAIGGEGGEGYRYSPGEWAAADTRASASGGAKE